MNALNIGSTVKFVDEAEDSTIFTITAIEPGDHQDRLVTLKDPHGETGYVYIWAISNGKIKTPLMDEEEVNERFAEVSKRD